MAHRLADGSIQMADGRILYANSVIIAADLIEVLPLLTPPPAWPFISGGGGGGSGVSSSPGARGADGAPGAPGAPGTPGAPGAQGPQGTNPGVQGPQGNQGNLGAQGNQGIIGTGTQGFQGFQGSSSGGGGLFENNQSNTIVTTDAIPAVILSETIGAASVATFRAVIDARFNDGSQHASFVRTVRVHREGGGAVLGIENADYTDDSSLALVVGFVVSGNDIQMQVTGVIATTITWKARMGRVILP